MIKIILFLLGLSVCSVFAQMPVEEAFGIKLGGTLDTKNQMRESGASDGFTRTYYWKNHTAGLVSPSYVTVSTLTNKVVEIAGSSYFYGLEECNTRFNNIKEKIIYKYGREFESKVGKYDDGRHYKVFVLTSSNGNYVTVACYEADSIERRKFFPRKDYLEFHFWVKYSDGRELSYIDRMKNEKADNEKMEEINNLGL